MPQRTNPFQKLCASIMLVFYEPEYQIEESILEKNPRTGVVREIDIRIKNNINPNSNVIIECRNHKRKQDVQWIDEVDGKARSLGYSNVIVISASGFSKGAIDEARDRGIEALHLKKAEEVDWCKWRMAIPELGIRIEGPVLRSIDFGIDAEWQGNDPEIIDISQVVLVDKRDNTKRSLLDWIQILFNDPEQSQQLKTIGKNGTITDLIKKFPCVPEMGFHLIGNDEFIPLVELTVHVDYIVSDDKVPLTHLNLNGKHILTGETLVNGSVTRVVMTESDKDLTISLEQKRPDNIK